MLASSRELCASANLAGWPQASFPAQGRAAFCRLRRPGKIFAGQGAAPLRLRLRRIHLPLQGRLYGAAAAPKAPLQGELAAKPTEGGIAALRRECPAKSGRALIRASQGCAAACRPPAARKDICGARRRTPPSAPAAHPPPLAGELAAKPTEGCIAGLPRRYPSQARQSPAPSCAGGGAPQPSSACHARRFWPRRTKTHAPGPGRRKKKRHAPGRAWQGRGRLENTAAAGQGVPQGSRRYSAMPPFFRLRRSALSRKSS